MGTLYNNAKRVDTNMRDCYAQLKEALASRFAHDMDSYYAIKDPYMDTLYFAALEWQKNANRKN